MLFASFILLGFALLLMGKISIAYLGMMVVLRKTLWNKGVSQSGCTLSLLCFFF